MQSLANQNNFILKHWFSVLASGQGISESAYDMWTLSFKDILSIHHAMQDVTVMAVKTSDQ